MMRFNTIKQVERFEQKVKIMENNVPGLLMIDFQEEENQWICTPHYPDQKAHKGSANYGGKFDRLQDYCFPEDFHGRVIMDTFGSNDPDIYGNLFFFDIDDLREKREGKCFISKISDPGEGLICEITTGWKEE